MKTRQHGIDNGAGWQLCLFQTSRAARLARDRRPVLILAGYGVNSLMFSYHPRGPSTEAWLADAGFEVWRVDLRAHGASVRRGGTLDYGLWDLGVSDIGAAVDGILERTETAADRVDVVGASLGGTLMFIQAALNARHRIGAMVGIGTPVRWVRSHPALRLACALPEAIGLLPLRMFRGFVGGVLPPVVRFAPGLLRACVNTATTDALALRRLMACVESPSARMVREVGAWIRKRDLVLSGANLSESLRRVDRPLLCVVGNKDGLVPRETGEFPFHNVASRRKSLLEVGSRDVAVSHVDLFFSNEVHAQVLQPISSWLLDARA